MSGTVNGTLGSRAIPWSGVRNIDGYVARSAALFGLVVDGYTKPNFVDYVNADADASRMRQMINQRRRFPGFVATTSFREIAHKYGYTFEGDSDLVTVASLTLVPVDAVSATASWTAFDGATGYEYQLYDGDSVMVDDGTEALTSHLFTGLTLGDYSVKVRAITATGYTAWAIATTTIV